MHEQRWPSAPHPGPGTEAHAFFFAGNGHVDNLLVISDETQQLLQVDARDGCGEVYPGALQAAIEGEAWIHHC